MIKYMGEITSAGFLLVDKNQGTLSVRMERCREYVDGKKKPLGSYFVVINFGNGKKKYEVYERHCRVEKMRKSKKRKAIVDATRRWLNRFVKKLGY